MKNKFTQEAFFSPKDIGNILKKQDVVQKQRKVELYS